MQPKLRFRIDWQNSEYKVTIPKYDGGEVVDAESYDKLLQEYQKLQMATNPFIFESKDEVIAHLREHYEELADEPCTYGDNCPEYIKLDHGRCNPCKARMILNYKLKNE